MPNQSDFQGTTGTDLSLFAELEQGQCSIMGYNWVTLKDLMEKMQWLQTYQKQASITSLNALMTEFQRLGKAVLVRQGPSCNMAVAGAINCKLLYFPYSDPRCALVARIEKVNTCHFGKNPKFGVFKSGISQMRGFFKCGVFQMWGFSNAGFFECGLFD